MYIVQFGCKINKYVCMCMPLHVITVGPVMMHCATYKKWRDRCNDISLHVIAVGHSLNRVAAVTTTTLIL